MHATTSAASCNRYRFHVACPAQKSNDYTIHVRCRTPRSLFNIPHPRGQRRWLPAGCALFFFRSSYHLYCVDPPLDVAPEGEWACPAHKPGRKRSKELGQLERDQEIRAQAAAGGFRPKPPRTDARYQAPPAVYISGLFFCTWHKTARSS